jgi:hypothetical protein
MKTVYLRGHHDQPNFHDVLVKITYTGASYTKPWAVSRSYYETSEREWLDNPDGLERRNINQ